MIIKLMILAVLLTALILAFVGVFFEFYDRIVWGRKMNSEYIKTGFIIIVATIGLCLPIVGSLSDSPKRPIHTETKTESNVEETTIVLNGKTYVLQN